MNILEIFGQAFAIVGAAIFIAAAIGLIRLQDPYTRTSAVATAAGLGVSFIVGGVAMMDPQLSNIVKVIIAIFLQLTTSAVGGIAIARSAVMSGHRFSRSTDTGMLGSPDTQKDEAP